MDAQTTTFDATWDTQYQCCTHPPVTTRDEYEAACALLAIPVRADADCRISWDYPPAQWAAMSRDERVAIVISTARRYAIDRAEKAARLTARHAAPIARPAFGASGRRYDESCAHCGHTTTVDNGSGLCARCHR